MLMETVTVFREEFKFLWGIPCSELLQY